MVGDYHRGLGPTGHWCETSIIHALPAQLPAPATLESGALRTAQLREVVRQYRDHRMTPVSYVGAPVLRRTSVYELKGGRQAFGACR